VFDHLAKGTWSPSPLVVCLVSWWDDILLKMVFDDCSEIFCLYSAFSSDSNYTSCMCKNCNPSFVCSINVYASIWLAFWLQSKPFFRLVSYIFVHHNNKMSLAHFIYSGLQYIYFVCHHPLCSLTCITSQC